LESNTKCNGLLMRRVFDPSDIAAALAWKTPCPARGTGQTITGDFE
jgi:hypothetical protein